MESKRNETFGGVIFGTNMIQRTWSASQEAAEAATRVEGAALISWATRAATNLLLPPIYTHVPQKHPGSQQKKSIVDLLQPPPATVDTSPTYL